MIELLDFFVKYFNVIILIVFFVCGIVLGYIFGRVNSITDDIKSLDYDKLKYEYNELKRSIVNIEKVKKNERRF